MVNLELGNNVEKVKMDSFSLMSALTLVCFYENSLCVIAETSPGSKYGSSFFFFYTSETECLAYFKFIHYRYSTNT